MPLRRSMPRFDPWPTGLAMVLPLAIIWTASRATYALRSGDAAQTYDLVFGVILLTVGVHARNFPFQHASGALHSVPLPMDRRLRWRQALAHQRRVLAAHYVVVAGVLLAWNLWRDTTSLLALADWTCLCAAAAVAEPWVAGASARWGRRFPGTHPIAELQRSLGGGWTRPEAVIHLYAGGGAVAIAALIAMPLQLAMLPAPDAPPLAAPNAYWSVAPLALVPFSTWWGRAWFAGATFESTPWLHEASRTLAGPPTPTLEPRWIHWVPDPVHRFRLLQFSRAVSLMSARLLAPSAWALFMAMRGDVSDPRALAVGAFMMSLWLVPALRPSTTPTAERLPWASLPRHSARRLDSARLLPPTWILGPVLVPAFAYALHLILIAPPQ